MRARHTRTIRVRVGWLRAFIVPYVVMNAESVWCTGSGRCAPNRSRVWFTISPIPKMVIRLLKSFRIENDGPRRRAEQWV